MLLIGCFYDFVFVINYKKREKIDKLQIFGSLNDNCAQNSIFVGECAICERCLVL